MGRYVARRLLQMIPVFIGTTAIIFALTLAIGGDPVQNLYGERPVPDSVRIALTQQYHLDEPWYVQYGYYLSGLVQGDFGQSLAGRPIADMILESWPHTVRLALIALIVEATIGIAAGLMAGLKRGSFVDNLVLLSTLSVISIPIFVIGNFAQIFIGVKWGLLPVANVIDGWQSYLMPGIVLGSVSLAYIARLTRASVAENLRTDYVRTAKAKGLPQSRIFSVHVLRNSLIPVVTYLGVDIGTLMGGAMVTERIFNVPGVGFNVFKATQIEDGPVLVGFVSMLVLVYLFASLLVDLLYAVLDPRIRYV
ncbi:ABC transporter permease subunit [Streptomyces sp. TRM43335]|uniref:ABC transporter permease subunit n=1 Tax=Streptomyces taklimakanensis TaxID=2569853 RepID=A0A6G2BEZ3_9ACTN|nr:ABC transporter permease [Streptomyces taklimakanensis]MTE20828.1 ABC transporter permease subunit [Streptomyces taklimakanensis]